MLRKKRSCPGADTQQAVAFLDLLADQRRGVVSSVVCFLLLFLQQSRFFVVVQTGVCLFRQTRLREHPLLDFLLGDYRSLLDFRKLRGLKA